MAKKISKQKAAKRQYKLRDLLARCKGRNPHPEMIGGRVGKEVF
jgi:hypothetical protein